MSNRAAGVMHHRRWRHGNGAAAGDKAASRATSRRPRGTGQRNDGGASEIALGLLPEHIGYVVRRAQLAIFKDFIHTMAGVDIRPAQYSVLLVIARNPGLTQAELGRTLAIKRANLVGMLDELERRKLARRVPSPADRRSHALHLTGNGRKMLARFRRLAMAHEKRATRTLDAAEKRALLELLHRVARSLA